MPVYFRDMLRNFENIVFICMFLLLYFQIIYKDTVKASGIFAEAKYLLNLRTFWSVTLRTETKFFENKRNLTFYNVLTLYNVCTKI